MYALRLLSKTSHYWTCSNLLFTHCKVERFRHAKLFNECQTDDWHKLYLNYNNLTRAIILYYTAHYNQKKERDLFRLASESGKLPTLKKIMYTIKNSLFWRTYELHTTSLHYMSDCKPLSSLLLDTNRLSYNVD